MALGAASQTDLGPVVMNAPQSSSTANPQAVLDDPVNGSLVTHLSGKTAIPPTVARNGNSGTGSTVTLDPSSTDICGQIALTTGSASWSSGVQCTVTLGTSLVGRGFPVISPGNALTASLWSTLQPWVSSVGPSNSFSLQFGVADSASHALVFNYAFLGV